MSGEPKPRLPAHEVPSSLFTQIFALVLATVAVAQIINLLLFALVPPDPPRSVSLGQLASAIERRDTRILTFRTVPVAPGSGGADNPAAKRLAGELAVRLHRGPEDVSIALNNLEGRKFVEIYTGTGGDPEPALLGHFQVGVRQAEGWLLAEPLKRGLFDTREQRFMALFLASAFAMLPIAWIFARRLAQPFEQFADAAEALGRDPRAKPELVDGPAEVERASEAFRVMQQRLSAYVTDRTQMLAAIAHDLRTPLTRLAFRIEALDEPKRGQLSGDIKEMESMVQATLGLARTDSQPTIRERLELGSLVEKVADDLALTGRKVSAEVLDTMVVEGDPIELRRLVSNLLENGESYGRSANARVWRDDKLAVIDVEDEGPGLPRGEHEQVFEPFYRLEPSRSRETGGIGLGLAVVRSIARAHGGDVILENRKAGGLRARVTLPLAKPTPKKSG